MVILIALMFVWQSFYSNSLYNITSNPQNKEVTRMKETSSLAAIAALVFLASLLIIPVAAYIVVEDTKRDPKLPQEFSDPPGESNSWAYQYAHYDPQTQKYSNILQDHAWDINWHIGEMYDKLTPELPDEDNPWCETTVLYWIGGDWSIDTHVKIQW